MININKTGVVDPDKAMIFKEFIKVFKISGAYNFFVAHKIEIGAIRGQPGT